MGDSIITSRLGGRRVYTFFAILLDGKLRGWVVLDWSLWRHDKKNSLKNFCIIKEKIAYLECVIQITMFYRFYLFLSILFCNVDSALVSDSNVYVWFSNCILLGISNFIGNGGGGGGVCAERDVTQQGSYQQTWQSVMVGGRWVKKGNFSVT